MWQQIVAQPRAHVSQPANVNKPLPLRARQDVTTPPSSRSRWGSFKHGFRSHNKSSSVAVVSPVPHTTIQQQPSRSIEFHLGNDVFAFPIPGSHIGLRKSPVDCANPREISEHRLKEKHVERAGRSDIIESNATSDDLSVRGQHGEIGLAIFTPMERPSNRDADANGECAVITEALIEPVLYSPAIQSQQEASSTPANELPMHSIQSMSPLNGTRGSIRIFSRARADAAMLNVEEGPLIAQSLSLDRATRQVPRLVHRSRTSSSISASERAVNRSQASSHGIGPRSFSTRTPRVVTIERKSIDQCSTLTIRASSSRVATSSLTSGVGVKPAGTASPPISGSAAVRPSPGWSPSTVVPIDQDTLPTSPVAPLDQVRSINRFKTGSVFGLPKPLERQQTAPCRLESARTQPNAEDDAADGTQVHIHTSSEATCSRVEEIFYLQDDLDRDARSDTASISTSSETIQSDSTPATPRQSSDQFETVDWKVVQLSVARKVSLIRPRWYTLDNHNDVVHITPMSDTIALH